MTVPAPPSIRRRRRVPILLREERLTYPHLLAADCVEGTLWTDSERMPADSPSRGGPVPVPAPQREWVAAFLRGDDHALCDRFGHDPCKGVRIGEAAHPGPRVPRTDVDLRERALGTAREIAAACMILSDTRLESVVAGAGDPFPRRVALRRRFGQLDCEI